MAKKQARNKSEEELDRQSRKDILRARKESEQKKQIRLAVGGVVALLALVFLIAIVNEFFIAPNRPVATVNGEDISLNHWEDRVRYERAQRIISLENQYEAFGGDVGIIQQFSQQTIIELLDDEAFAETILNQMTDELIIRQAAEERGISVSEAELDEEIGSFFNYFGGESPTPAPEPTETIMPTPSLTPIPTAVITDVLPTNTPFPTVEVGPTEPAQPTATPVTKESFDEQFGDLITQFSDLGVDKETFREVVGIQLYLERLADEMAEEENMPTEAPHASVFLLSFDTEEDANEALAMIQSNDFLTVWNTIRSAPADAETTASATEIVWRTQEDLSATLGEEAAESAFVLPPNVPSTLFEQQIDEETTRYQILQVSGREVRQLSEATLQSSKTDLVRALIAEQAVSGVELFELWRSRVPTQPILDLKFLAQPTPAPEVPEIEIPTDEVVPSENE